MSLSILEIRRLKTNNIYKKTQKLMWKMDKLLKSFTTDIDSYNQFHYLITKKRVHEDCLLDSKVLLMLEQPIRTFDYPSIKEKKEELDDYTKVELSSIINNLLEERQNLLKFLDVMLVERKVKNKQLQQFFIVNLWLDFKRR